MRPKPKIKAKIRTIDEYLAALSDDKRAAFLDISVSRRDSPVYRIISLDRFYELFAKRQNVLVNPSMWDDPFENFILKSQSLSRQGWFGQCWTRHRASDAMWRIYSNDSRSVRIRSTPARLLQSLISSTKRGQSFVGAVRYLPHGSLMRFAQEAISSGNLKMPKMAARTLLVKRPAFRHEAEVRLLFFTDRAGSSRLFRYQVDPHSLIDQVMLDPRLPWVDFKNTKAEIQRRTGYAGSIKRSLLYAPPQSLASIVYET